MSRTTFNHLIISWASAKVQFIIAHLQTYTYYQLFYLSYTIRWNDGMIELYIDVLMY